MKERPRWAAVHLHNHIGLLCALLHCTRVCEYRSLCIADQFESTANVATQIQLYLHWLNKHVEQSRRWTCAFQTLFEAPKTLLFSPARWQMIRLNKKMHLGVWIFHRKYHKASTRDRQRPNADWWRWWWRSEPLPTEDVITASASELAHRTRSVGRKTTEHLSFYQAVRNLSFHSDSTFNGEKWKCPRNQNALYFHFFSLVFGVLSLPTCGLWFLLLI